MGMWREVVKGIRSIESIWERDEGLASEPMRRMRE
jgi:hypothetical protein